jgi:acyl-CoA thioester hydrolase
VNEIVVERLVDWQDTDAAGHYHHSTVIRWVEAAEAALLDRIGLRWLFGHVPRVRYEVDYLNRMWFGDTASIALSIAAVGRTSLRYDFVITRIPPPEHAPTEENSVAVRGAMTAVHVPGGAHGGGGAWPVDVAARLRGYDATQFVSNAAGEPNPGNPSGSDQ